MTLRMLTQAINTEFVDKIKAKAKQLISADQMKKAEEYVLAGGDVKTIKSKYKLTAAQEKTLNGKNRTETTSEDTKTSK